MAEWIIATAALVTFAYAIFGGADFGGGIWDLFATGPRRQQQRAAISNAMGPVWEANHVWLIFLIVILFTAFPAVYATLSTALFLPFHLVLFGIVLRGAAFVFRAYGRRAGATDSKTETGWGAVFGAASTITPLLLGMCMGAVATGDIRLLHGQTFVEGAAWLAPVAIACGLLALSLCAYLAAVFLILETSGDLQEDFRSRALIAGTFTVALSVLALPLIRSRAPHLWDGLLSLRAAPIVTIGVIAALAAGWLLRIRKYRAARFAAVLQILALLGGWMAAQYPYIVYPDITIRSAAAPNETLRFFVFTLPVGALLLGPSLWYLFHVFKRDVLVAPRTDESPSA